MSHGSRRILSLFLDANVLISAAWKEGTEISHVWSFEGIQLLTSSYVMGEVQRNLPAIDQVTRRLEAPGLEQFLAAKQPLQPTRRNTVRTFTLASVLWAARRVTLVALLPIVN